MHFCLSVAAGAVRQDQRRHAGRSLSCTPSLGVHHRFLSCVKLVGVHEEVEPGPKVTLGMTPSSSSAQRKFCVPRRWSFVDVSGKSVIVGETFFKLGCAGSIGSRPHAKSPVGFGAGVTVFDFAGSRFLPAEALRATRSSPSALDTCHQIQRCRRECRANTWKVPACHQWSKAVAPTIVLLFRDLMQRPEPRRHVAGCAVIRG